MSAACRFGYVEYDATQYCHEHGGFRDFYGQTRLCDRATPHPPRRPETSAVSDRDAGREESE